MAGFASFQLISYHLKTRSVVPDAQIPIVYAILIGVDAVAALVIAKAYGRAGLIWLAAVPLLTFPTAFFAFSSQSYDWVVIGVVRWGVLAGIQETVTGAAIADLTPSEGICLWSSTRCTGSASS